VVKLLCRHPRLRIRINGYAQPEAPSVIGEALAQSRATSVRMHLLTALLHRSEWTGEDPNVGVRGNLYQTEPWSCHVTRRTQLVGDKIQAVGRWLQTPLNENFVGAGEAHADDEGDDSDDDMDGKLRRAEFTLLCLASER